MPFPALSAILSVRGYAGLAALLVESLGEPVWHLQEHHPSSHQIFPTLCVLPLICSFSGCCGCWWWLRLWSGAVLDNPHCPSSPSCSSRRTQLCVVPGVVCAQPTIIIIPITSPGARCLDFGKGFTSWGEINLKQVKKSKSKCLHVSKQVKAPGTAGADVFCYQAAQTSEQLRS